MTTSQPPKSVPTAELYDRWAKVYDTDGNILQAIDDLLLPDFLSQTLQAALEQGPESRQLTVTELGAGTGRNTVRLLDPSLLGTRGKVSRVNALDLSPAMLSLARRRCSEYLDANPRSMAHVPEIDFQVFDAFKPAENVDFKNVQGTADLVVSTLVLEHLPLDVFFRTVKSLLKEKGGFLILSNMHAQMGSRSQAGFKDEESGEKVQGSSFVYAIEEVVDEAKKWGFSVDCDRGQGNGIKKRAVRQEDLDNGSLGQRARKWIDCKVWFAIAFRSIVDH